MNCGFEWRVLIRAQKNVCLNTIESYWTKQNANAWTNHNLLLNTISVRVCTQKTVHRSLDSSTLNPAFMCELISNRIRRHTINIKHIYILHIETGETETNWKELNLAMNTHTQAQSKRNTRWDMCSDMGAVITKWNWNDLESATHKHTHLTITKTSA